VIVDVIARDPMRKATSLLDALDAWADDPIAVQVLLALRARLPRAGSDAAPSSALTAPEAAPTGSRILAAAPSPPPAPEISSKKKQEREPAPKVWLPDDEQGIPDDFRAEFDRVIAERGVRVLPAEAVWGAFVNYLHDEAAKPVGQKRKTFTKRSNAKRYWAASWCRYEKPLDQAQQELALERRTTPAPAGVHRESTALFAQRDAEELQAAAPESAVAISARLASGDFFTAERLASSASRRSTGPPMKAPLVA